MKIELTIDSHQFTDEIQDLLANLSLEQKQTLAAQAIGLAVSDVHHELDRVYMEQKALDKFNAEREKNDKPLLTLEGAKNDYSWNRTLQESLTIKGELISAILQETVSQARGQLKDVIEKDEQIQKVIQETIEVVKKDFPVYVKNAMTMYLATQMQNTMAQIAESTIDKSVSQAALHDLNQRLLNRGM